LKYHPKRERKYHLKNIKEFINRAPDLDYAGYLLALDGSAERIYP